MTRNVRAAGFRHCAEAEDGIKAIETITSGFSLIDNIATSVDTSSASPRATAAVADAAEAAQQPTPPAPSSHPASSSQRLFDVILMDMVMPNCDGLSASRAIRALGFTGVILGITGNAQQSDIDSFLDAGADAVLSKPIKMEQVLLRLSDLFH